MILWIIRTRNDNDNSNDNQLNFISFVCLHINNELLFCVFCYKCQLSKCFFSPPPSCFIFFFIHVFCCKQWGFFFVCFVCECQPNKLLLLIFFIFSYLFLLLIFFSTYGHKICIHNEKEEKKKEIHEGKKMK
jgi:hypothetical protein